MKSRFEIRLSLDEMGKLIRVAGERRRTRTDTIRVLLVEEFERIESRGDGTAEAIERKA